MHSASVFWQKRWKISKYGKAARSIWNGRLCAGLSGSTQRPCGDTPPARCRPSAASQAAKRAFLDPPPKMPAARLQRVGLLVPNLQNPSLHYLHHSLLCPVFDFQIRHTLKLPHIVCYQDHSFCAGMGSDQHIQRTDRRSLTLQISSDLPVL